jgi:hypothetical protein
MRRLERERGRERESVKGRERERGRERGRGRGRERERELERRIIFGFFTSRGGAFFPSAPFYPPFFSPLEESKSERSPVGMPLVPLF